MKFYIVTAAFDPLLLAIAAWRGPLVTLDFAAFAGPAPVVGSV